MRIAFLVRALELSRLAMFPSLDSFEDDPYLKFQPAFALSMPIQVLMNTITLTLVTVLVIQLAFTAQYHWPLAKLNFLLQFSGALALTISLVATVTSILACVYERSREWPYMISYIAIAIPPDRTRANSLLKWTWTQHVVWAIMEAVVSGLVHVRCSSYKVLYLVADLALQIANIQYLTLLYPSRIERWLINCLLVPLAVVSSVMEIVHLHSDEGVRHIGDTLRNVCNCTLSLLFTIALCMWGFVIHRRQAWRTDGGTAVFGAAAILLAAISSALNIIILPAKNQLFWLQPLVWSVVLWQSFLGWWWWVGCAVEANNVEDMIVRERKRGTRRARKKAGESSSGFRSGVNRVVGTLRSRSRQTNNASTVSTTGDATDLSLSTRVDSIEMADMTSASHTPATAARAETRSLTSCGSHQPFWTRLWRSIRRDHETAALEQALELTANGANNSSPRWGFGRYALQERENAATRVRELREDEDGEARGLVREPEPAAAPEQARSSSVYWWGPLVRWRLQDRTVY